MPTHLDTIFLIAQTPAPNPAETITNLPPTAVRNFVVSPSPDPGNLMMIAMWTPPERFD